MTIAQAYEMLNRQFAQMPANQQAVVENAALPNEPVPPSAESYQAEEELSIGTEQKETGQPTEWDTKPAKQGSWPYSVERGRMVLQKVVNGVTTTTPIADLEARIVGEIMAEDGTKSFVIEGKGIRGSKFTIEIPAAQFGDVTKLLSEIEAVSARDGIRAGMKQHLGPAIKAMTNETWMERRFTRVGWADKKFLIPGRVTEDIRLQLNDKLAYRITDEAELDQGLSTLPYLVEAPGAQLGAILLAFMLQAPLARIAGWENERYGLFVAGRSGTRKTSTAQAFMALYGPQFMDDDRIVGLGDGSTTNAIIGLATAAHDMPFLLDNYKSNTGKGQGGLVGLIHRIFEGGDKARMNRNAELRDTKPVHTWPIFTGEDLPAGDSASLARVLVIPFQKVGNEALTKAQAQAKHLCAVGGLWLDWLESVEGRKVVKARASETQELRDSTAKVLLQRNPNIVNPYRIATNLATNSITWAIALEHPKIGPMLAPYRKDYIEGLNTVAKGMSNHTEQALEATRYLRALRELLATGRAVLMAGSPADAAEWNAKTQDNVTNEHLQERVIGWVDGNGGAYLLPALARKAVALTLGDDLSAMSDSTLYDQLAELGAIHKGKDKTTVVKRFPGSDTPQRVIHLSSFGLSDGAEDTN